MGFLESKIGCSGVGRIGGLVEGRGLLVGLVSSFSSESDAGRRVMGLTGTGG